MEKSWTKGLFGFLAVAGSGALIAFLSGIIEATLIVIFPVLLVGIIYISDEESEPQVQVTIPLKMKVGDEIEVKASISISKGLGFFLFELPFFEYFETIDKANVAVIFKGFREKNAEISYRMVAKRRGKFEFNEIKYTYNPAMGVLNSKSGKISYSVKVEVLPKVTLLSKRSLKIRATRLNPRNARSRIGPASTDFDMVRLYTPGDPYRAINWKATARSTIASTPLVNQYEREGIHTSMFVLDNSTPMRQGTKEENLLEYAIRLILAFSNLLLTHQHNVGLWIMQGPNTNRRNLVLPQSGQDQYLRLRRELMLIETPKSKTQFYPVDKTFASIARETLPTIFMITNVTEKNSPGLTNLMKRLHTLTRSIRLIDVLPYSIFANASIFDLVSLYTETYAMKAKRRIYAGMGVGSSVTPWDPGLTSYGRVIAQLTEKLR